jgi:nitrite reductase (NADH) small subunit
MNEVWRIVMAWQAVVAADKVTPGKPVIVEAGKKQIGILLHEGRHYAVLNFCPHAGAPVCEGEIENPVYATGVGEEAGRREGAPVLRCPWHHWEFDLQTGKGLCVKQKIRTYPVEVRDGQVWIDV